MRTKMKQGQPKVTLGVRLSPGERQAVERLAEARGIKLSEAARLIYRAGLEALKGGPQRAA
jgi:hypothetical protein